jgi:hypothetical protein
MDDLKPGTIVRGKITQNLFRVLGTTSDGSIHVESLAGEWKTLYHPSGLEVMELPGEKGA